MALRIRIVAAAGGAMVLLGLIVRLSARAIVPNINEMWSPGDWSRTASAFYERAWGDVGVAFLLGGFWILGLALYAWCRNDGA